jgi:hypothetical protein
MARLDLFTVGKVPMYLETIGHRIRKRKSGKVKEIVLTLRVEPFTHAHASALEQSTFKALPRLLFKADGDPTLDLSDAKLRPFSPRQQLLVHEAEDMDPSIAFDQAEVTGLRVRKSSTGTAWALYLQASFGPLDRRELEYINSWYTEQRLVTSREADPSLEFADDDKPRLKKKAAPPAEEQPELQEDGTDQDDDAEGGPAAEEGHRYPRPATKKKGRRRG